jgi:hypothetical protein
VNQSTTGNRRGLDCPPRLSTMEWYFCQQKKRMPEAIDRARGTEVPERVFFPHQRTEALLGPMSRSRLPCSLLGWVASAVDSSGLICSLFPGYASFSHPFILRSLPHPSLVTLSLSSSFVFFRVVYEIHKFLLFVNQSLLHPMADSSRHCPLPPSGDRPVGHYRRAAEEDGLGMNQPIAKGLTGV